MKNVSIFIIITCFSSVLFGQEYCPIPLNVNTGVQVSSTNNPSSDRGFYLENLETWIPRMTTSTSPLQNSPIKVIEVNFNVIQRSDGTGNYPNSPAGKLLLIDNFLKQLNTIYTTIIPTSDPFSWVVNLPYNDSRIRFDLGKPGSERIYYYPDSQLYVTDDLGEYEKATNLADPNRLKQVNVYFTESYYYCKVAQKDFTILNKGSGYTTAPKVVAYYKGKRVNNVGVANILNGKIESVTVNESLRYYILSLRDGLNIQFEGGGGTGATAKCLLSQGASGMGTWPDRLNYNRNSLIYMFHHFSGYRSSLTSNDGDGYQLKGVLSHEFGHNLNLKHTFGDEPCSGSMFMTDLYGLTSPGTCPFFTRGENSFVANGDKITNNLMNYGDIDCNYMSPMQVGKMHMSLSTTNMSRFVKECYSPTPLVITKSEVWDWRMRIYQDIVLNNGGIINIKNILTMPVNGRIIVNNGGKIILGNSVNTNFSEFWAGIQVNDGGTIELNNTTVSNCYIIVKSGGTLKIPFDAIIDFNNKGKIEVESGAFVCIENGARITLQDFSNVINLRTGYRIGINPILSSNLNSNCSLTPEILPTLGNGKINIFNNDLYIQNETFASNKYLTALNIFSGEKVTNTKQYGNVLIQNGTNVIFDTENEAILDKGFEVQLGATFEIK